MIATTRGTFRGTFALVALPEMSRYGFIEERIKKQPGIVWRFQEPDIRY